MAARLRKIPHEVTVVKTQNLAKKYAQRFQHHWELPMRLDKYLMQFNGICRKTADQLISNPGAIEIFDKELNQFITENKNNENENENENAGIKFNRLIYPHQRIYLTKTKTMLSKPPNLNYMLYKPLRINGTLNDYSLKSEIFKQFGIETYLDDYINVNNKKESRHRQNLTKIQQMHAQNENKSDLLLTQLQNENEKSIKNNRLNQCIMTNWLSKLSNNQFQLRLIGQLQCDVSGLLLASNDGVLHSLLNDHFSRNAYNSGGYNPNNIGNDNKDGNIDTKNKAELIQKQFIYRVNVTRNHNDTKFRRMHLLASKGALLPMTRYMKPNKNSKEIVKINKNSNNINNNHYFADFVKGKGRVSTFNQWCLDYYRGKNIDTIINKIDKSNKNSKNNNNKINMSGSNDNETIVDKLTKQFGENELIEMDLVSKLLGKGSIIESINNATKDEYSSIDNNIPLEIIEDELIMLENNNDDFDSVTIDDGIPKSKFEDTPHPDSELTNKKLRKKRKPKLKIETIIEDTKNKRLKDLYDKYLNDKNRETQWDIGISCGDKTLLKKMIESLGFNVTKMERIGIGPLIIDNYFEKEFHSNYCDLSQNDGFYYGNKTNNGNDNDDDNTQLWSLPKDENEFYQRLCQYNSVKLKQKHVNLLWDCVGGTQTGVVLRLTSLLDRAYNVNDETFFQWLDQQYGIKL